ncbi:MAG: hypothetical protein ACI9OJ_001474 [Myxococcota bacterium]|jgi:hypothetical protein
MRENVMVTTARPAPTRLMSQAVSGTCAGVLKGCDDDNPCTADSCNATTGICSNTAVTVGTSCNNGNLCVTATCGGGVCLDGADVDCNDNSLCTTDGCSSANGCINTPKDCSDSAECTVDTCAADTGAYYVSGGSTNGTATLPSLAVPDTGAAAITFGYWVDTEVAGQAFDVLRLKLGETELWSRPTNTPVGAWQQAVVPLTDYAGEKVELSFTFETGDTFNNTGEGVYIDNIDVSGCGGGTACDPGNPATCDDGNPCTSDSCAVDDGCSNVEIPNCLM